MEEIRILGIAPFESIRAAMERVAREEFPEVRFEAYTGDLEEGVKIAQRLVNENESYDVMISRGGTAELLKQKLTMPVVEITFSVYDILRAIKMAENYNRLRQEAEVLCYQDKVSLASLLVKFPSCNQG